MSGDLGGHLTVQHHCIHTGNATLKMYRCYIRNIVEHHPVTMLVVQNVDHFSFQATLSSATDPDNLQHNNTVKNGGGGGGLITLY
jgi:hypothetical protein